MSKDPLELFPVERWSELEEVFEGDFPRSISGFTILQRQRYILQCGLDYGFKVYCPFGDVNNGMVAINIKNTYYELVIQCPRDDTNKVENALKATTLIDWKKELEIASAPTHVMNCVKRVLGEKRLGIYQIITTTTFILNKSSPLFNVTLPQGLSFELLSLEHIDLLDSTWSRRYSGSKFYFELLIKAKLGYGLFRNGKLISWALIKEMGSLAHLYTLQEERRMGYGELVLKSISNIVLKDGKYVVAFCLLDNINAVKLYQKLNFQNPVDVDWCMTTGKYI